VLPDVCDVLLKSLINTCDGSGIMTFISNY
jgi:hypothetical protein